ncbi:MAG: response regulator [Desulfobacter sp.]|nr:response regulator [Desulfobacter sp.]
MKDPIKVLMVDDEKRFRETTRKILSRKGFDTILAENGIEALEKLKQDPDVVVLDIRMPGMDGHEVLAKIRETDSSIPVIMLTGHGDKPSAEQALEQGAFDYLGKPCDIDLLSDRIKEACLGKTLPPQEARAGSVMIPLKDFTTIDEASTVAQAVNKLKVSSVTLMATSRLMKTGHRSVLVTDISGGIQGMLTIRDLLELILPGYLSTPKPSLADAIEYSPMFWQGMFSKAVKEMGTKLIRDVMSPSPVSIDSQASLMEAAYLMVSEKHPRLIVEEEGVPVGVLREQDLFFEMETYLKI